MNELRARAIVEPLRASFNYARHPIPRDVLKARNARMRVILLRSEHEGTNLPRVASIHTLSSMTGLTTVQINNVPGLRKAELSRTLRDHVRSRSSGVKACITATKIGIQVDEAGVAICAFLNYASMSLAMAASEALDKTVMGGRIIDCMLRYPRIPGAMQTVVGTRSHYSLARSAPSCTGVSDVQGQVVPSLPPILRRATDALAAVPPLVTLGDESAPESPYDLDATVARESSMDDAVPKVPKLTEKARLQMKQTILAAAVKMPHFMWSDLDAAFETLCHVTQERFTFSLYSAPLFSDC